MRTYTLPLTLLFLGLGVFAQEFSRSATFQLVNVQDSDLVIIRSTPEAVHDTVSLRKVEKPDLNPKSSAKARTLAAQAYACGMLDYAISTLKLTSADIAPQRSMYAEMKCPTFAKFLGVSVP